MLKTQEIFCQAMVVFWIDLTVISLQFLFYIFGYSYNDYYFRLNRDNWKKYIIPIPDASKLTQEQGMFWYAEGPEGPVGNEVGYTFWVDELKYEKLGTIAQAKPKMFNGEDKIETSFGFYRFNKGAWIKYAEIWNI